MKQKYDIVIADPEGNITIFVLTRTPRSKYAEVARKLMDLNEYKAEQVCFVIDDDSAEMCGLEFCGNASRAFGLIKAKKLGIKGEATVRINMSGAKEPLEVLVDTESNYTKIRMPIPFGVSRLESSAIAEIKEGFQLDFDGITHVVVFDIPADRKTFNTIKDYIQKQDDPPAIGVMFYDRESEKMTPIVYVKDVDTTYFEGSCGSGTTATAITLALDEGYKDGSFLYEIRQPSGSITSTVSLKDSKIESVSIEGSVLLSPVISVEI